jgi:hypothetical protein
VLRKLPRKTCSTIDELYSGFRLERLNLQDVSMELEVTAIEAYGTSARNERGHLLEELKCFMYDERWYFLKKLHKSPSVLGKADVEVTLKFIKEIQETPIPILNSKQFIEEYVSDLGRHLAGRIVLPWSAINLAFEKTFHDAKAYGKSFALQQVLDLVQNKNGLGWNLKIQDKNYIKKHQAAMMGYGEWLRQRLARNGSNRK